MNLHRAPLLIGALAIAWIIQIVAFPQIDSLLFFERILAVNRTSDQSLLAKVYAEDLDWRVTDAALEGLTDQNALAKIVLTKRGLFQYKSKKALSKLNDQALLAKVALAAEDNYYDSAGGMRGRAVEKLTDQTLLATVALDAKGSSVRESAVSKLDENTLNKMGMWVKPELTKQVQDQELLKKIIESANDIEVCKAAVSTLSDQTYLVKLALENERGPIGSTAVNRLTDPTALAKVFVETPEQHIRKAAESQLLEAKRWARLSDQSLLVKFAVGFEDGYSLNTFVSQLANQALLSHIAVTAKDWRIREVAVSKLTDQAILAKVAVEDKVGDVREAAVGQLTDQATLAKVAVDDKVGDIRKAAVRKLTDQTLLRKLAQTDKVATIRVAAVVNITDIQFLFDLANTDSSLRVRSSVVANLKESSDILRFATEGFHTDVRDKAYSMLSGERRLQAERAQALLSERTQQLRQDMDSTRLLDQCLNGKYDVLRWAAAESLLSDNELRKVAVSSCDRQVLRRILGKIQDRAALNEIATSAKDIAMRVACAQKLEYKFWGKLFDEVSVDAEALGNAVAAFALFPVQVDAKPAAYSACYSLIQKGDESLIPEMIDLLERYGDERLCEYYLNCGQPDLGDAGGRWAHKRGYSVERRNSYESATKWGGM
jgi:hypothetical protein